MTEDQKASWTQPLPEHTVMHVTAQEVPLIMLVAGEWEVIGTSTISADGDHWRGKSTINDPEIFKKLFQTSDTIGGFAIEVRPSQDPTDAPGTYRPVEARYIPPMKVGGDD